MLPPAAYSPDSASDYHFFHSMPNSLFGDKFNDVFDVKN